MRVLLMHVVTYAEHGCRCWLGLTTCMCVCVCVVWVVLALLLQGDESRAVFKFTPLIAPIKATVFPLLQKQQLNEPAAALSKELTAVGLSNIIDTTGG